MVHFASDCILEHEEDSRDKQNLFDNVLMQPCEVVFAEPQLEVRSDRGSDASSRDSNNGLVCLDINTGEMRCMAENEREGTEELKRLSDAKHSGKAWGGWWQDKKGRDEKLWLAAARTPEALRAALAPAEGSGELPQVNSRSLCDRTALHIASFGGIEECVSVLLEARADVKARTDIGLTPLHVACQQGHVGVAQLLLESDAGVFAETNDRSLPLHLAAGAGHSEVCGLLLEYGGQEQLLHRNTIAQRPLDVSRDISTFEFLRQRDRTCLDTQFDLGCDVHVDSYAGRTPFHMAGVMLRDSRADVIQSLLHRMHRAPPVRPTLDAQAQVRPDARKSGERRFSQLKQGGPAVEAATIDSFSAQKKLGQGSFGVVYKVVHKTTNATYAMKILDKSNICASNSLMRYTMTERNLLSYVKHPYIVSMQYAFQTPSHLVLVLEFCSNGNMQNLLKQTKRLNEDWSRLYAAEVLLALSYLHQRDTVYRDLKPENVVLDYEGHAKLTDFGLSKEKVAGPNGTKSFCGSIAFMAPEVIRRSGHGHTVDIYGLGVLVYCMFVGMPPFYDRRKETLVANIKHAPLRIPSVVPPKAASFVQALMQREPQERLGATKSEDCQSHEWFNSTMDFDALMRREVPLPEPFETLMPSNGGAGVVDGSTPTVTANFGKFTKANTRAQKSHDVEGWNFASPLQEANERAPDIPTRDRRNRTNSL